MIKEKICATLAEMQSDPTQGTSGTEVSSMDARREEIATIGDELRRLDSEAGRLRHEIGRLSNPVLSGARALLGTEKAA